MLCLYYSREDVHHLVTENFPLKLVNKKLRMGRCIKTLGRFFFPLFMWSYTPVHAILPSFLTYTVSRLIIPNYLIMQKAKLAKTITRGGVLNGSNHGCLRTVGQLLVAGELTLLKTLLECGILKFTQDVSHVYIWVLLSMQKINGILFLLYDRSCKHFPISGFTGGHQLLLSGQFSRCIMRYESSMLVEFMVHNHFVFGCDVTHVVRFTDKPLKLFNLYRAGIYLHDPIGYVKHMDEGSTALMEYVRWLVYL